MIAQIDPREYELLDLGTIRETRQKRYGNTLLVFFEPVSISAPAAPAPSGIETEQGGLTGE